MRGILILSPRAVTVWGSVTSCQNGAAASRSDMPESVTIDAAQDNAEEVVTEEVLVEEVLVEEVSIDGMCGVY